MAIDDLWRMRDGSPSKRDGRGMRWRVRVQGYPSTMHRTKAEAERINAQRQVAGPPRAASTLTVGELLDRWLAGKQSLSRGGYGSVKAAAAQARTRWATTLATDVQRWEAEQWLASLKVGRATAMRPASAETRVKALQALRGALNIAVEMGMLDRNPVTSMSLPRRTRRDPRYLTVEQLRSLTTAAGEYGPMVWLMGTCGTRIGETCALNVGDVDLKRRRVRVRTAKSGRGRDVPVPRKVLAMLNTHRGAGEPLFASPKGARVDKDHWRARAFNAATAQAGLVGLVPHDLRHTGVADDRLRCDGEGRAGCARACVGENDTGHLRRAVRWAPG